MSDIYLNNRRGSGPSKGFAALGAVVVLGALCLLATVGVSRQAQNSLETLEVANQGEQAGAAALACLEEGLIRLRTDASYRTGGDGIVLGQAGCQLAVNGGSGTVTVEASGSSGRASARRSVTAAIDENGFLSLE